MAKMEGLAHVGLFIKDADKSRDFYNDILGFETTWETELPDGTKVVFVKNGNLVLEIVQLPTGPNTGDGVVDHIATAVEDIESVQKKLEEKGIEFETEAPVWGETMMPNGSKWLMFRGPDGEHLELTEVLPY